MLGNPAGRDGSGHADRAVSFAKFNAIACDLDCVGGVGLLPFLFSGAWRSEFISFAVGFAFHFDALFEVFLRHTNGSAIQFSPVRELLFPLFEDFVEFMIFGLNVEVLFRLFFVPFAVSDFESAGSRPLIVAKHGIIDFGGQLDLAEQLAGDAIVGVASPLDRLALELLLARHRRWIGSHCVPICVSCSVMNSAMLPSNSSTSSRTERHDRKHSQDVNDTAV